MIFLTIFLLYSTTLINVTFCIKSKDFCRLTQDEHNDECPEVFSYKCGIVNICSKNQTSCKEYKKIDSFLKIIELMSNNNKKALIKPEKTKKYLKESIKFKIINHHIQNCDYKFNADHFCLNEQNCIKKKIFDFFFGSKFFDCECSEKHSFKCGQYCTIHSDACNYHRRLNETEIISRYFTKCSESKISKIKSHFKYKTSF